MKPDAHAHLTPSTARRRLGGELQKARTRARLSLAEAAKSIERSAPTLSRLENGKTIPRLVDVRALIEQYKAASASAVGNGDEQRILTLAERARQAEWFASFRDVLSGDLTSNEAQRLVEFEGAATVIRAYEPELISGLMQTPDYAAAVTEIFFPERDEDDRRRLVEFRMKRQQILRAGEQPTDFHLVLGEAALRRVVRSPTVMREQLSVLLDAIRSGRPNVVVRVAPLTLAVPAVFGGPFMQMDLASDEEPAVVYLEGREGSQFIQTEDVVDRYRNIFAQLAAEALDADHSAYMIEEAVKALS